MDSCLGLVRPHQHGIAFFSFSINILLYKFIMAHLQWLGIKIYNDWNYRESCEITFQIDSMLPCVCLVIDHRWRLNVVRTKKWHTRRQPSLSLMFLPYFDVFCDLLLNRRTVTWNPFCLYKNKLPQKKLFYFKIFQHDSKAGLCPALRPLR